MDATPEAFIAPRRAALSELHWTVLVSGPACSVQVKESLSTAWEPGTFAA
jgi:hypothetical protein